jgi:glucose-1-phosphate thymidylyltransferase
VQVQSCVHTHTHSQRPYSFSRQTILSIIIDQLHEAGITDFIFIVGYLGGKDPGLCKSKLSWLTCHFVYQNERYGTGHAIDLAKEIVGEEEVIIVLGTPLLSMM